MIERAFLTIKEAAPLVGVHHETLRRWIKKGHRNCPPHRRLGRRLIGIPRDKFYEWLKGDK